MKRSLFTLKISQKRSAGGSALRSRLHVIARGFGLVATAAFMVAVPIGASANTPDGAVQFVHPQAFPQDFWRLNGSNQLIDGGGDGAVSYFQAVYFSGPKADEIRYVNSGSSLNGHCLGWDQGAGVYDVRASAACNSSGTTGTWDLWQFGSSAPGFSEASTLYGWARGDCAWDQGQGDKIASFGCNGSTVWDRFEFVDEDQG
jgi:hypothetical protein